MRRRSYGCLGLIIEATKWLPVIVTCTIFFWGWYAYTLQLGRFCMEPTAQKIVCLTIFHVVYLFSFWSYMQTIFTSNGKIPSKFFVSPEMIEEMAKAPTEQLRDEILLCIVKRNDLPVYCRTYSGGVRYCEKCNLIKPDRCHHCSICGVCILKMDHHCPWINNCVSFTNYKFFVLFLGYTFALAIFVAATTFPYFYTLWVVQENQYMPPGNNSTSVMNQFGQQGSQNLTPNFSVGSNSIPFNVKFHILFLFFVSSMLSLGVLFLYCYHVYLLLNNRSTLESFRPPLMTYGPDRNAFNLGHKENLTQLFGRSKLLWLVPMFTTEGSGFTYDQRPHIRHVDEEVRQELLNSNQNASNNNGRNNMTNGDSEV